ncbi:hypothetical protein QTH91_07680 [Variovorax dokdonensis]|uniref:Uncharacterized protein n=2 Tax=Variovorax dokdonensis TaxID=344883 RepID=A0ABT7N8T7_9BURK|nr:hypothetical protein [Variovorax dokdonensis]MDM0044354.1 hypothetical protein [Variovorax dokdonensis]
MLNPSGEPYSLGQPLHVYDREHLLGILDPLPLLHNGTQVHIEGFVAQPIILKEDRHVGRLIFLEVCAFLLANFPQIQSISFRLTRHIDVLGAGERQAAVRTETMLRIGASDVNIAPHPDASPGHFVVSGVWVYNNQNLAALHEVLEEQRALYADVPIGSQTATRAGVVAHLRALIFGRKQR